MTENAPLLFRMAGLLISVRTLHDGMLRIGRNYLAADTGLEPDISVVITQRDVDEERRRSPDGGSGFSDRYMETLAVCRRISERMPSFGRFLMHGSAIAADGEGFIFTAPSGTGKSTHARLWREMLGDRAVMINDDKPFVGAGEDGVTVYGSPWNGKHRLGGNISAPLKAVCILGRAAENSIEEIGVSDALPVLIRQIYRPDDPMMLAATLTLADRLASSVKLFRLGCNMAPEAARVSYEMMKKEG
ncbi:MAG: hypothetical protein J6V01_05700 [Clostridia bacterium]|nr:hypothetical protein [Clostridia bacterium]